MAWMHTAIDVMLGLDRRTVRAGKERMESSQVGSVGQSVNQSINQSINQSTALHGGPSRHPDQIRSDSTQLNSTQLRSSRIRSANRVVASRPILNEAWWGGGVRRGDADAMRCTSPAAADDFYSLLACLLACLLAGLLAGLVNNLLDRRNCSSCWCSPSWLVFRHRALQISLDHFTRTPGPSLGAGSGNPSVRV
jgi:hypothetical protein